jgi:hypothetical protein
MSKNNYDDLLKTLDKSNKKELKKLNWYNIFQVIALIGFCFLMGDILRRLIKDTLKTTTEHKVSCMRNNKLFINEEIVDSAHISRTGETSIRKGNTTATYNTECILKTTTTLFENRNCMNLSDENCKREEHIEITHSGNEETRKKKLIAKQERDKREEDELLFLLFLGI